MFTNKGWRVLCGQLSETQTNRSAYKALNTAAITDTRCFITSSCWEPRFKIETKPDLKIEHGYIKTSDICSNKQFINICLVVSL